MFKSGSKIDVIPVVLAGGVGRRLWPLSRPSAPKQYLKLFSNKSLLQETLIRLGRLAEIASIDMQSIILVSSELHIDIIRVQTEEFKYLEKPILEPSGRNTAPSLTLAAFHAIGTHVDPVLVVSPADHFISDDAEYIRVLTSAIEEVDFSDISTIGIKPSRAEPGFGYIKSENYLGSFSRKVIDFIEKPDPTLAKKLVDSGRYFWNGGVFVVRARVWLELLKEFSPDIYEASKKAWNGRREEEKGVFFDSDMFLEIPSDSIDKAVVERCPNGGKQVGMLELDAGWSDLGSWESIFKHGNGDENGNVILGPGPKPIVEQTTNTLLFNASEKIISTAGANDLVVIATADAMLVADRHNSLAVGSLPVTNSDLDALDVTYRPWGWFKNLSSSSSYKVKLIHVSPGQRLSLQRHRHRSEHWTVVSGVVDITVGDTIGSYPQDHSVFIPIGAWHRLGNSTEQPSEVIEVQLGSYLEEDDIERKEDDYGRVSSII